MEKVINVVTTEGSMLLRGIRSDMRMKICTEKVKNVKLRVTLPNLAILLEVD